MKRSSLVKVALGAAILVGLVVVSVLIASSLSLLNSALQPDFSTDPYQVDQSVSNADDVDISRNTWTLFSTVDSVVEDDYTENPEEDDTWFFILSDVHLDILYQADVGPDQFCRALDYQYISTNCTENDFVLDPLLNNTMGQYGCDSPITLAESAFQAMQSINPTPEFIILSGDMSSHCSPSLDNLLEAEETFFTLLRRYFPDTPVYPVIGNDDVWPDGQMPIGNSLLLDSLYEIWELPTSVDDTFLYGGYYSLPVMEDTYIIGLNTVFYRMEWCEDNTTVCYYDDVDVLPDPADQFDWLFNTLGSLERLGKKAIIVGHLGPEQTRGFGQAWPDQYQQQFQNIVQRYYQTIVSMFFAHIHRDSFAMFLFTDSAGYVQNLGTLLVDNAITPSRKNNPSFRHMKFSPTQNIMVDYENYYLNLDAVMHSTSSNPEYWQLQYVYSEAYAQESLTRPAVLDFYMDLVEDDQLYSEWLYNWAAKSEVANYNKHTKAEFLCDISTGVMNDLFNECIDQYMVSSSAETYEDGDD